MIIGYSFEEQNNNIKTFINELSTEKDSQNNVSSFSKEWLRIIPPFNEEKNEDIRQELRWHVYTLESMATYSSFYKETKIPQGTIYDYDWGIHASARDNCQHTLPLIYYNLPLAESSIKYMLERTTEFGEVRLIEKGNGYADNERYFTSDQQLYLLFLISEYLRITKNYKFLNETVTPYPVKNQNKIAIIEFVEKMFIFLRDTIGVGKHGLIRLLNSDWNDAVYYIEKVPYSNIFFTGESHMNSAMAICILQNLIPSLDNAIVQFEKENSVSVEKLSKLCNSMKLYRKNILNAFITDLNDRSFPKRMYFNNKPYGENNMFLEPQGFTLQINEISINQKKNLYAEMKKRLYSGEKLGAREQEKPEFEDASYDKGSRENGGFWWALNGPAIIGVNTFDKNESLRLFYNMTLKHCAESFPKYWCSYWSSADNLESSLIPEEGLSDQSENYSNIPVFCAHPHAWIVYCYYKLHE